MKQHWSAPGISVTPFDVSSLGDVHSLSDAALKIRLEQGGYVFSKQFQANPDYIHRVISGSDVLISVGGNIANFNGYIELNPSAAFLWDQLQTPQTLSALEAALEGQFGISHEQAAEDVLNFVKELQDHEMVSAV